MLLLNLTSVLTDRNKRGLGFRLIKSKPYLNLPQPTLCRLHDQPQLIIKGYKDPTKKNKVLVV